MCTEKLSIFLKRKIKWFIFLFIAEYKRWAEPETGRLGHKCETGKESKK